MISKPVKTSISSIKEEKIYRIEDAVKIRDNPKIKLQKGAEVKYKDDFDTLWQRYIYSCEFELKQAYNTILKKKKIYSKHLKEKFSKSLAKTNRQSIIKIIEELNTTDKQKKRNHENSKNFF